MQKQVIVISGIPGSGKTTLAREIWEIYPKETIVISNDSLRCMLTMHTEEEVNQTYHLGLNNLRSFITTAKEAVIKSFLTVKEVKRIVVDACHFDDQSLQIFNELKCKVIFVKMEVDKKIALKRCQNRIRKEDEETINFVSDKLAELNFDYSLVIRTEEDKNKFLKSLCEYYYYTGLFVKDIPGLVAKFVPKHNPIYAHHSTISFQPLNLDGIEVGKVQTIKIIGRAFNDKGDALLVENPKSANKYPHITLSCVEGIFPEYSNELLEQSISNNTIEYFSVPIEIEVVEGYHNGEKVVMQLS